MNHDINVKKMRLNCFRQSKVPGEFMLQMRVPGGMVDAKYLSYVEHIANTWGDGNFHFGTRQTFDITGIKYENIPAVNEYLEQYIKEVDAELCGVNMDTVAHEPQPWDPKAGYPTIGARNITACVGNYHCICGNCNTFELARKIEPIIFPSHYHIKINIAGCPNDCNKAHLCDFGIIGVARMTYHPERCIGCGACVRACEHGATRVLSLNEGTGKIEKDPCCCVGCGECVKASHLRLDPPGDQVLPGHPGRPHRPPDPPHGQDVPQLGHRGRGAWRAQELAEVLRLGHGLQARVPPRRTPH